jgi:hypothetical protein
MDEQPNPPGAPSGKDTTADNSIASAAREGRTVDPPTARPATASDPDLRDPRHPASAVPPSVASRFVQVGRAYYFADKTLAFTDHGSKLTARTHNLEVVHSLIDIAEARGWSAITVRGTETFRRAVWREASLRDVEVKGYAASDHERAERHAARSERASDPGHLTGRLIEHGPAQYRFDPKGGLSYYLKLRTRSGDRTLWGVDIERALVESQSRVQVGDLVVVENRGTERVKVKLPQRDEDGNLTGERLVEKRRNLWRVESAAWFDERAQGAAALREARTPDDELARQHPELANAIVALWLGRQFAERHIEMAADRGRLLAALRGRLAHAFERGEVINVPFVKERPMRTGPSHGTEEAWPRARARAVLSRAGDRDRDSAVSHARE